MIQIANLNRNAQGSPRTLVSSEERRTGLAQEETKPELRHEVMDANADGMSLDKS